MAQVPGKDMSNESSGRPAGEKPSLRNHERVGAHSFSMNSPPRQGGAMSEATIDFVDRLVDRFPNLKPISDKHLSDNFGEVLEEIQ